MVRFSQIPGANVIIATMMIGSGFAGAQEGAEAELPASVAEVKAAFDDEIAKLVAPIDQKYADALQRLEKEFSLRGNYEAAMTARDERRDVERSLETREDNIIPEELVIPAAAANSMNGATPDGEGVRFGKLGDLVEWTVAGIEPGAYEIFVQYASPKSVSVRVQEYFFRLSSELPATDGAQDFQEHSIGVLKVTDRATSLSMMAGSVSESFVVKGLRVIAR
ncbi:MAG: hypothetical protein AAGA58_01265 [Verrucomicrobiota bacterium]